MTDFIDIAIAIILLFTSLGFDLNISIALWLLCFKWFLKGYELVVLTIAKQRKELQNEKN